LPSNLRGGINIRAWIAGGRQVEMKIRKVDLVEAKAVEVQGAMGVRIRLLIHAPEGAPNFYMRQFIIAPGGYTPRHRHAWEHEVYILAGSGMAVTPDGEKPIQAGDCAYVAPNDEHQFRNTGPGDLKFLCLVPTSGR